MEGALGVVLIVILAVSFCTTAAIAADDAGTGAVRLEVLPKHVYAARDDAAPRWWLLAVAINTGQEAVTLERVTTTLAHRRGPATREQTGDGIKGIVQGARLVPPGGVVVLEMKDAGEGPLPTAITLKLAFTGSAGKAVIAEKQVPLERRFTLYLRFPMAGRWIVGNGRETSHGLGRTFAIDLCREEDWPIHEAEPKQRLRLEDFAGFGQPVLAPADGVVVACEGERPEEIPTPGKASYGSRPPQGKKELYVGNYLALRLDGGQYLWLVHLRQGSLRVKVGDRVREGQPLAQVGNSGNTSGPHLHVELLDEMPDLAKIGGLEMPCSGLPFGFKDAVCGKDGRLRRGRVVPARAEVIEALPRGKL